MSCRQPAFVSEELEYRRPDVSVLATGHLLSMLDDVTRDPKRRMAWPGATLQ